MPAAGSGCGESEVFSSVLSFLNLCVIGVRRYLPEMVNAATVVAIMETANE
jgi:hypothetical protein